MNENQYNDEFINNIWNDANFISYKKTIKQTGESIKKDSIRRFNNNNMIITNCKYCNCEMEISTNYSGVYPLCEKHRNPNERIKNKRVQNKDLQH